MTAPMAIETAHGPVEARPAGPGRYATNAPCVVHGKHIPASHVNEVHHVWPKGLGGPDIAGNRIVVCATGHNNIHKLIAEYRLHKGQVPYQILRAYAFDERRYAKLGYERITRQAM